MLIEQKEIVKITLYLFDLINRQEAEKQDLEIELQAMRNAANGFKKELFDKTEQLKTAKSEAVKDFAERLKEKKQEVFTSVNITELVVTEWTIDNLVKEMVGE